jgi:exopolysaccharide biosynthesis protein
VLAGTGEGADWLRAHARLAVNVDGGGSTTMAIRGTVVNRPSDATGERPIGDALLLGAQR